MNFLILVLLAAFCVHGIESINFCDRYINSRIRLRPYTESNKYLQPDSEGDEIYLNHEGSLDLEFYVRPGFKSTSTGCTISLESVAYRNRYVRYSRVNYKPYSLELDNLSPAEIFKHQSSFILKMFDVQRHIVAFESEDPSSRFYYMTHCHNRMYVFNHEKLKDKCGDISFSSQTKFYIDIVSSSPPTYPTNPQVIYPTNPRVYPTNPRVYPTNPRVYPTNPQVYPTIRQVPTSIEDSSDGDDESTDKSNADVTMLLSNWLLCLIPLFILQQF